MSCPPVAACSHSALQNPGPPCPPNHGLLSAGQLPHLWRVVCQGVLCQLAQPVPGVPVQQLGDCERT